MRRWAVSCSCPCGPQQQRHLDFPLVNPSISHPHPSRHACAACPCIFADQTIPIHRLFNVVCLNSSDASDILWLKSRDVIAVITFPWFFHSLSGALIITTGYWL